MNQHTYRIFEADDISDDRMNLARREGSFHHNSRAYGIYVNGRLSVIQSEKDGLPYPGALEESAQAQIAEMEAQGAAAEEEVELASLKRAADLARARIEAAELEVQAVAKERELAFVKEGAPI